MARKLKKPYLKNCAAQPPAEHGEFAGHALEMKAATKAGDAKSIIALLRRTAGQYVPTALPPAIEIRAGVNGNGSGPDHVINGMVAAD